MIFRRVGESRLSYIFKNVPFPWCLIFSSATNATRTFATATHSTFLPFSVHIYIVRIHSLAGETWTSRRSICLRIKRYAFVIAYRRASGHQITGRPTGS